MSYQYYPQAPGPKNPNRYPIAVGPSYQQWGEQQGWIYNPYQDKYYPDPKSQEQLQKAQGLIEEPPGLLEQALPLAGTVAAGAAAKAIGAKIPDYISGGFDGLFGGGEATAATQGASTAAQVAPNAVSSAGMMPSVGAAQGPIAPTVGAVQGPGYGVANAGSVDPSSLFPAPAQEGGFSGFMGGEAPLQSMPYLQGAAGLAGMYVGGKGVMEAYENEDPVGGALSGAALGAGTAMTASSLSTAGLLGASAVPGIGWAIAAGALLGVGAGLFGHKPRTEEEDKRMRKLQEQGIIPPDMPVTFTDKGRDEQLKEALASGYPPDFAGFAEDGRWVNTKFLASGNESDLRPEDIWGYAAFFEKYPDWLTGKSEEERRQIADMALQSGAVREHHGTIDIDWDKVEQPQEEQQGAN